MLGGNYRGYENGNVVTSTEFRGWDNQPAPLVKYSKRVNGTYYVVEAVAETKYKKFWVVSSYMVKADTSTQASDAHGSEITSSTAPASFATITPQPSVVNTGNPKVAPSVGAAEAGFSGDYDAFQAQAEAFHDPGANLTEIRDRGDGTMSYTPVEVPTVDRPWIVWG